MLHVHVDERTWVFVGGGWMKKWMLHLHVDEKVDVARTCG
jgi:hypothetical protein